MVMRLRNYLHFFFGVLIDLLAIDADGADLGFEKAHENAKRDGLADAAAAQDAEGFAAIHGEADVVEDFALAKPHGDVLEGDEGPGCLGSSSVGVGLSPAMSASTSVGDLGNLVRLQIGRGIAGGFGCEVGGGHEIRLLEVAAGESRASARARSAGELILRNQEAGGKAGDERPGRPEAATRRAERRRASRGYRRRS